MKTDHTPEKLSKYTLGKNELVTNFDTYDSAVKYALDHGGTLVEVGFLAGTDDEPQITETAGLVANHKNYYVNAGPDYKYIHHSDPEFQQFADDILNFETSEIQNQGAVERNLVDSNPQLEEDPVVVLYKGEFDSVTSRERSKYLRNADVYELGVLREL